MKRNLLIILLSMSDCLGMNLLTPDNVPSLMERDFLYQTQIEINRTIDEKIKIGTTKTELNNIITDELNKTKEKHQTLIHILDQSDSFYYFIDYHQQTITNLIQNSDKNFSALKRYITLPNSDRQNIEEEISKFDRSIVELFTRENNKMSSKRTKNNNLLYQIYQYVFHEIHFRRNEVIVALGRNIRVLEEYYYHVGRLESILNFDEYTNQRREELFFEMYPQLMQINPHPFSSHAKKCCVIM